MQRSGSEAPLMSHKRTTSTFGPARGNSSNRNQKIEPKSTWEPNEQGE